MIKWVVFCVIALVWIAVCYFFGSMVGLTDAQVAASMAQRECADRLLRAAGGAGDYEAFRYSAECMGIQRTVLDQRSAPARRTGLLVGVLPVLLVGAWMRFGGRRNRAKTVAQ